MNSKLFKPLLKDRQKHMSKEDTTKEKRRIPQEISPPSARFKSHPVRYSLSEPETFIVK